MIETGITRGIRNSMAILEDVGDKTRCIEAARDKAKLGISYGAMRCPKCGGMVHWQMYLGLQTAGLCETDGCIRWLDNGDR